MDFSPAPPLPQPPRPEPRSTRGSAILEIVLCSGVPSQFALTYLIALTGLAPHQNGRLSFVYVTTLLLLDATVMIAMIWWFLRRHGEHPQEVFLGDRPRRHEIVVGIAMTGVVFALALIVLSATQRFLPSLHNVTENPLQQLIATPNQAIIFAAVATIAGGLREEIQRAFIIHRFDQHLGGAKIGLIVYSLVFGLGHSLQGWDAVLTTTILGLFWGSLYLSRRSILAPVVSHSGFNAAEIFQFFMMAK